MEKMRLPNPDKNGIINVLPTELSEANRQRLKKFGTFVFIYDFAQKIFHTTHIHRADPQRHREIMKSLVSPIRYARILDIACGTGTAISYIDDTNEYFGIDLSYTMLKQAVKKAKKKNLKECRFIQGSAEKLPFENGSFDYVLMDTALHMVPQYELTIAEIGKVLTKDGIFICSSPVVGINDQFDNKWEQIATKHSPIL